MRVRDVLRGRLQFRVHSLSVLLRLLKCWNEMALWLPTTTTAVQVSLETGFTVFIKVPSGHWLVGRFWFGLWLNIQLLGVLGTSARE